MFTIKTNKKKQEKKSFGKMIATSKGFYITLCTVFAIVGFSVYSNHLRNQFDQKTAMFQEGFEENPPSEAYEVIDVDEIEEDLQEEKPKVNSFDKVPEVVQTAAPANEKTEEPKFSMEYPARGIVLANCSIDELVFCSTMEDWRTHNGIDIAGDIGSQVKAAEAGVVSKVYRDELLGIVVEIDHGNEILSRYANLQNEEFISVGTKVQKGDIIGGIGECGALENTMEPHLHFEVLSHGEYKDPNEFINN